MIEKIYEVEGIYTINVKKRVKARDEDEAIQLAEELFEGLHTEIDGTSVFVTGFGEEISAEGCIEWRSACKTDNEDYDEWEDFKEED